MERNKVERKKNEWKLDHNGCCDFCFFTDLPLAFLHERNWRVLATRAWNSPFFFKSILNNKINRKIIYFKVIKTKALKINFVRIFPSLSFFLKYNAKIP